MLDPVPAMNVINIRQNGVGLMKDTILHELAHMIARAMNGVDKTYYGPSFVAIYIELLARYATDANGAQRSTAERYVKLAEQFGVSGCIASSLTENRARNPPRVGKRVPLISMLVDYD